MQRNAWNSNTVVGGGGRGVFPNHFACILSPLMTTLCPRGYNLYFTAEDTEAQPQAIQLVNAEPGLCSFSEYF